MKFFQNLWFFYYRCPITQGKIRLSKWSGKWHGQVIIERWWFVYLGHGHNFATYQSGRRNSNNRKCPCPKSLQFIRIHQPRDILIMHLDFDLNNLHLSRLVSFYRPVRHWPEHRIPLLANLFYAFPAVGVSFQVIINWRNTSCINTILKSQGFENLWPVGETGVIWYAVLCETVS